jgi:iron complex transport system permease protein
MKNYRQIALIGGGFVLLLFTMLLAVSYSSIKPGQAIYISPYAAIDVFIKWLSGASFNITDKIAIFRLQRVFAAAISGMLLAIGGTLYQTTLMNPLVDPYLLGVSAGASLGAVIAYRFHLSGPVWLYAFVFAILSFAFSYVLGGGNRLKIVLSGVVISSLVSAGITLVLIMWNDSLHNILAWLMGSFAMADGKKVLLQSIVLIFVFIVIVSTHRVLDIMLIGDEVAHGVGVNVFVYRLIYLVLASLAAAFVAAFYGIVSFVGLMAPHLARLMVGDKHLSKLLLSMEIGAILLVVGDFLSRGVMYPMEIPIGVFTSVVGGVFFLYLVVRGEWL